MDITTYFESDDFLNMIAPLGKYYSGVSDLKNIINFFISAGIDYWRLFNDSEISIDKFNHFMNNVVSIYENILSEKGSTFGSSSEIKRKVLDLYLDDLLDKFNLNSEDLSHPVVDGVLREFIVKKTLSTEYKFHAFNGSFLDSIREHGVDPSHKFEDQDELDMISEIFERHGEKLILGWQGLNCKGNVSYSNSANNSYYYAINSPEWFSQFTGQGSAFNPEGKYSKDAFIRRDYNAASNNLMTLMQEKGFSSYEIETVNVFFNKYWDMYVNEKSIPMLCVIPDKNKYFDSLYGRIMNNEYCKESFGNLMTVCLAERENDGRTDTVINTENALFIRLPQMSRVLEKMNIDGKDVGVKK